MPRARVASQLLFACLLALGVQTCARFRIEELKPNRLVALSIARADAGNSEQLTQVKMSGHVPYNLPVQPVTDGSRVYVTDPERRMVRVFDNSGELVKLIAPPGTVAPEDAKLIRVQAGIPGLVAVDDNRTIFVQYRRAEPLKPKPEKPLPVLASETKEEAKTGSGGKQASPYEEGPTVPLSEGIDKHPVERIAGIFDTRDRAVPPSVIVQINKDDKVAHTIGKQGAGSEPFGLILRMDVDPKNRLIVTYREGDAYRIGIYENGVRVSGYENLNVKGDPNLQVRVEDAAPGPAADFALLCVVYRDRKSFNPVFRKVFRVDSPEAEPVEIHSTDDVRDFCGRARGDKGFYMLNAERDGSRVLFKIFSPTGEYVNNRLVRFPGMHASWRRTYMTLDGRIFSSRVYRGKLELYEWK